MERRVLGVSLGSLARDFRALWRWEGGTVEVLRLGTGGSVERARQLLEQYDGRVDAFGLGGVNVYLQARGRRYRLPLGERLSSVPRQTPVCDGTFVKTRWEPWALRLACQEGGLSLAGRAVLFSSVLDRWPLAEAVEAAGARVLVGDAAFALGVPILFPGLRSFYPFAVALVPLLRRLPLSVLYPQARRQPGVRGHASARAGACSWKFARAGVLAGDFHFFRRCLPPRLDGRWVIASGLDGADRALLAERGVSLVVELGPVVFPSPGSPTPRGGPGSADEEARGLSAGTGEGVRGVSAGAGEGARGLSANLAEAVVVAASGRPACDLGAEGVRAWCRRLGFHPSAYRFTAKDGVPISGRTASINWTAVEARHRCDPVHQSVCGRKTRLGR